MRGSTVKVRRSLRSRVVSASALAFLGLASMVCVVLPRAYEAQTRTDFERRAENAARGLAILLHTSAGTVEPSLLPSMAGWLIADPAFEGAFVVDGDGVVAARWPENSPGAGGPLPATSRVITSPTSCTAFETLPGSWGVAVRYSTRSLVRDLENVRWLFASIFLFTCGVFFILTNYLTRTILQPIEGIGRAAMSLADGEPVVQVPQTGDREIDELGEFISKLGESRRQSRVMTSPMDLLIAQNWGRRSAKRNPAPPPGSDPPRREPSRPPVEDPES